MYNLEQDPKLADEIELLFGKRHESIKITHVVNQKLVLYSNNMGGRRGMSFSFFTGKDTSNRMRVQLNAQQGNTGGVTTHALNRWWEEVQAVMRNTLDGKVYKSTAYLPNTQEYLPWLQFVEFEHRRASKMMWAIWNNEYIIESSSPLITDQGNIEYTFDWRKRRTLQTMLDATRTL